MLTTLALVVVASKLLDKRTQIQLGMTDSKEYYEMYDKVQRGEITQEDWVDYCMKLLFEIMEDNKDVFIRLKNRG
jgi:hypothetical protein